MFSTGNSFMIAPRPLRLRTSAPMAAEVARGTRERSPQEPLLYLDWLVQISSSVRS